VYFSLLSARFWEVLLLWWFDFYIAHVLEKMYGMRMIVSSYSLVSLVILD